MRLDKYIVDNFGYTRSRAIDLIKVGSVYVNGEVVLKPSKQVSETDKIKINDKLKYVSRAGVKLEEAVNYFNLDFKDKTVLDVGSSTGGFTEVSLKYGAKTVYAYDVGKDQMDEELRKDKRIHLFEQTNILSADVKEVDICLIDVSFVSIKPIIKHLKGKAKVYVMLFKPQFEVGPDNLYGGIIKNEKVLKEAILSFKEFLKEEEINLRDYLQVSLKGKKGNQEYIFIGDMNVRKDNN
jgi:23S rRNA (cytidine1920-2'-O)/16S rRNA (cytidine1409-2'-O)-methyltransferase